MAFSHIAVFLRFGDVFFLQRALGGLPRRRLLRAYAGRTPDFRVRRFFLEGGVWKHLQRTPGVRFIYGERPQQIIEDASAQIEAYAGRTPHL